MRLVLGYSKESRAPASGYPVSSAQRCGDALPRLQSPRMARCWSLMTRAARSGVLPTLARATVPLQIRIGRSRNGEKRLWDVFFVHKPVSATIPQCLLSEVKQTLALSSGCLFLTQSGYRRSGFVPREHGRSGLMSAGLFDRRALCLLARQSDGKVCGLSDGASSGLSRTRISFPVLK